MHDGTNTSTAARSDASTRRRPQGATANLRPRGQPPHPGNGEPASAAWVRRDRAQARRTVPRGASHSDRHSAPAVDFDTWISHVTYARTRDSDLLAELAGTYDRYARSLARRMHRHREPLDDLEQVAREALLAALGRFDPERRIPFPAFAKPTVLGALRRYYRDHGWALRVPRRAHELVHAREQSVDRLVPELGREPTLEEVASDLDIDLAELRLADGAAQARAARSLDAPSPVGGPSHGDLMGVDDADLRASDDRIALAEALDDLDQQSRDLLDLYYRRELTQTEIAERYDVSQMQVSRWLASIVGRLRSGMAVLDGRRSNQA